MKTIGFIGCGNMGGAIMGGIIAKGYADAEHIIAVLAEHSIPASKISSSSLPGP